MKHDCILVLKIVKTQVKEILDIYFQRDIQNAGHMA